MNGIVKENPTFVLLLGMCPTLGTTSSAINGMGMGLATMFVLICSNVVISLIKNLIPDMVRIPSFIVVIASFVTLLQMVMQAYVPGLYATLGLFIPLIVVNCIVLGRAEAFAAKNNALSSMFNAIRYPNAINAPGASTKTSIPYSSGMIDKLNTLPVPRNSRTAPSNVRAIVKPNPIPIPSNIEESALFLAVNCFCRPLSDIGSAVELSTLAAVPQSVEWDSPECVADTL